MRFYRIQADGNAIIAVRATPNARQDRIGDVVTLADGQQALKISVTAPPEDGKANAAVIAMLAKNLGIAKSRFDVISGQTDRSKRILCIGVDADLLTKLDDLAVKQG